MSYKRVAAAIIVHNGKIFIAQRPEGKSLAHYWELPGGKQEQGERLTECLHRELSEELNIDAVIGDFFMQSTFDYDFGTIELNAYFAFLKNQTDIKSNEHENTAWVTPQELSRYQFAPADISIIEALKKAKI